MVAAETRVAAYVRVSSQEQVEGYSIDAQLRLIREHCVAAGKRVVGEYVDAGVSGKSMQKRTELQRLLADTKSNTFDEVVVWKLNRVARNMVDLLEIVNILTLNDIHISSLTEPFDITTPQGTFTLQLLGGIGELERKQIAENVSAGKRQRAKHGRYCGAPVLGYEVVRASGDTQSRLDIIPSEAATVRAVYEIFVAGHGLKGTACRLNARGHRTKTGKLFNISAVARILRNPLYVGKIRYATKGEGNHPFSISQGKHEPIISAELWEKTHARLASQAPRPKKVVDRPYPLTGLLRCPSCGGGMIASHVTQANKSGHKTIHAYYICSRYHNRGISCCRPHAVRAAEVEKAVYDWFSGLAKSPSLMSDLNLAISHKQDARLGTDMELKHISHSLSLLETKRATSLRLYEQDAIEKNLVVETLASINKDKEALLKRQSEIVATTTLAPKRLDPKAVRRAVSKLGKILTHSTQEQRKTVLLAVIEKVILQNHRKPSLITVHPRTDFLLPNKQEGRDSTWNAREWPSTLVSAPKNKPSTGIQ